LPPHAASSKGRSIARRTHSFYCLIYPPVATHGNCTSGQIVKKSYAVKKKANIPIVDKFYPIKIRLISF
jgi:hypothetical protein